MPKRKIKRKIAVIDFETDPFLFGRVPEPFIVELWDGEKAIVFEGEQCAQELLNHLEAETEPLLIYAHNGGKFDFHFLHEGLENPALIIKNRIVSARVGIHELRDSFAILPVPLRNYAKEDIDYTKMEKNRRKKHMPEIRDYLHSDCVHLFNLVSAFIERFGPRMTIGSTAMREMQRYHPHEKCGSEHDKTFRPFYVGGRVQCFKAGILAGPWKYIDVNSMYPRVMSDRLHPTGKRYEVMTELPDNFERPFFITFFGTNRNALPYKTDEGELIFNQKRGWFSVCSHELEIALRYGLCEIEKVDICHVATETIIFDKFVQTFYAEKEQAKRTGDKTNEIFAKLIQNSGYGREGINPANFEDWQIVKDFGNWQELEEQGYAKQADYDTIELWAKPAEIREHQYADVAIAASITSAARAVLLEGLQNSIDPIYCDTDSIICRDFAGDLDPYRLGAWDLELECDEVAIAGKKMYVCYDRDITGNISKRKISSKGGTLTANEIMRVCVGETVHYDNMAPTFSLKQPPRFISRNFRKTALDDFSLEAA